MLSPCPSPGRLFPTTAGPALKSRYFPAQRLERLPGVCRHAEKPLLKRFFVCRGVEYSNLMLLPLVPGSSLYLYDTRGIQSIEEGSCAGSGKLSQQRQCGRGYGSTRAMWEGRRSERWRGPGPTPSARAISCVDRPPGCYSQCLPAR
jgi:hypothetical protein